MSCPARFKSFSASQAGAPALWLAFASLLLVCASCGGQSSGNENGGRTHWLAACEADSECGAGVCWQRRCTLTCNDRDTCSGLTGGAECSTELARAELEPSCTPDPDAPVCLPACADDSECSAAQDVCEQGLCVSRSCRAQGAALVDAAPSAVSADETRPVGTASAPAEADTTSMAESELAQHPDASSGSIAVASAPEVAADAGYPLGLDASTPTATATLTDAGSGTNGGANEPDAAPLSPLMDASDVTLPGTNEPGIWATLSLDGAEPSALRFEQAVGAYTRDPEHRVLVSIVANDPQWGSITLDIASNPGPVIAGEYTCTSGASLVSATMLTDTGVRRLSSDTSTDAGCSILVVEPGEGVGLPFTGTFEATLVSNTGEVLTITDGGFWGALNE